MMMYLTICAGVPQGRGFIVHGLPVAKEMLEAQERWEGLSSLLAPALIVITRGSASERVKGACRAAELKALTMSISKIRPAGRHPKARCQKLGEVERNWWCRRACRQHTA